jgi:hypothetical protein
MGKLNYREDKYLLHSKGNYSFSPQVQKLGEEDYSKYSYYKLNVDTCNLLLTIDKKYRMAVE